MPGLRKIYFQKFNRGNYDEQLKIIETAFYKLSHKWAGLSEPEMLEKVED